MNTKLSAQLFGLGLLITATACGSRTSLMQDDAGAADAGEQTSGVSTSSSGNRGGSGATTGRAGSGARAGAGRGAAGSAGGMARAGRGQTGGQAGGAATAGKGGAAAAEGGDKARGGAGGEKASEQGGAGGEKASEQGGAGGEKASEQGGAGGEKAPELPEQGGAGGEGGTAAEEAGAGGEAAGASGMAAAGSGGTSSTPLSMLSAEQKTQLCGRIDAGTSDQPLADAVRGYCSSIGLRQPEMCTEVRDTCFDGAPVLPVCADTVPECPSITEDEFVSCRIDDIKRFVEYNRVITCDNPNSVPAGTGDPASCVSAYERCPALRALAR